MDKISAQNLIKGTFNYPFDEEKFSKFSVNLLEQIKTNASSAWKNNTSLPSSIKENVTRYKIFGQMEYENGEKIIVAMIEFISSEIVEKSRHIQRDFAKWLIDKNDSDACLVSFFTDNHDDWRFSLVKIDYTREETKTGRIKVKQELTPLRRYSYLVGKNEPNHTAQAQLSPLLLEENKNPSLEKLTEAFSVEKVTKEFFNDYKKLTFNLAGELKRLQSDKKISKEFKLKKIDELEFAKKIMSQLIFIFFLQKKRLLAFRKNDFKNSLGEKNFLRKLFDKEKNYFNDILEPLFYEGFLNEHKENLYKIFNCFLPNISVSLFEPINSYDWRNTKITIDNSIFENILSVFERYNFTISEEQPLDVEVAVDPEMLGKVFESLIDENIRKSTGAFYTPRMIVHHMCKKSIWKYLCNNCKDIDSNNIEKIINILASDFHMESFIKSKDIREARHLYELIKNITIIDPAVGSGAYLVENLTILTKLIYNLEIILKINPNIFQIKKDIIKNNLYGTDIDKSAIEIAKLRLWLALIVNEEKIKNIENLPNLDFKIINLNSLLIKKTDLLNHGTLKKLSELYKKYFDLKTISTRRKMENEIINFKKENKINPDINSEFFGIFQNKEGFDIVLANPPYVGEKGNKEIFQELKKGEIYKYFQSKSDFFYYFIHLGLNITNPKGVLSFITTNYYFTATGATKLRKHIEEVSSPFSIINFKDLKIFESAQGQSNAITFLNKFKLEKSCEVITALGNERANSKILENIFRKKTPFCVVNNLEVDHVFDKNDDLKLNNVLSLESYESYSTIIDQLIKIKTNLGVFCNINSGADVVPSKLTKNHISKFSVFNSKDEGKGIFVLSEEEYKKFKQNQIEKNIIKKFIKSSDVEKFNINFKNKYLIYTRFSDEIDKLPNIKKHLNKYKPILDDQIQRYNEDMPWFALHRPGSHSIFESKEKIIAPYRAKSNVFGYTNKKLYSSRDNYLICLKNSFLREIEIKYILGILNSEITLFWLLKKGKRKGSMLELYPKPLEIIPIKNTDKKTRDIVINIVDELIADNKKESLEKKLNEQIYKIYQIDKDEQLKIKKTISESL